MNSRSLCLNLPKSGLQAHNTISTSTHAFRWDSFHFTVGLLRQTSLKSQRQTSIFLVFLSDVLESFVSMKTSIGAHSYRARASVATVKCHTLGLRCHGGGEVLSPKLLTPALFLYQMSSLASRFNPLSHYCSGSLLRVASWH